MCFRRFDDTHETFIFYFCYLIMLYQAHTAASRKVPNKNVSARHTVPLLYRSNTPTVLYKIPEISRTQWRHNTGSGWIHRSRMLFHCVHIGHVYLWVYILKIPLKTMALEPIPQLKSITDVTEVHFPQVRKTVIKVVLIFVSPHLHNNNKNNNNNNNNTRQMPMKSE